MRCKFASTDLSQRLNDTICRYKGIPYQVKYEGGDELALRSLIPPRGIMEIIKSDNIFFDISTVPLGYVQVTPDRVAYISRKPARIYKQGLSQESVFCDYLDTNLQKGLSFSIFSEPMHNMIIDKYPNLNTVLSMLASKEKPTEIAISRDVALKSNPDLHITYVCYKNNEIGFIVNGTKKVIIPNGGMAWVISKYLSSFTWEVE